MIKLNSRQLRDTVPTPEEIAQVVRRPIYFILEDVLDTYNIGAIFRVADAIGVQKIYLCGKTSTPPDHKIKKSSVGTWQWVSWKYSPSTIDAISELKNENSKVKVIAIEQDARSIPYTEFNYELPLAFVLGHETDGVQKETLDKCDAIVEIPLHGVNNSLNVMVACAIVSYEVVRQSSF